MTKQENLLEADHADIDDVLEQANAALGHADTKRAFTKLDYFWARLAMHIRAEHLHLFPALTEASRLLDTAEAAAIKNWIEDLHEDHNFFMREMIVARKTMRQIVADPDSDDLSRLGEVKVRIENVHRRLIVHNEKEESGIYPLADRLLVPDAAIILRTKIRRELDNLPPRFVVTSKERFNDQSKR